MLAIAFRFLAGRYHANPWGRHVNEADIAWPPEPWRIVRALIATWHLKVKHKGEHSRETLRDLVGKLVDEAPRYRLPPVVHSHTRHYLPQWKAGETSLVFDAFARVAPDEDLGVVWPNVDLSTTQKALLDDLLRLVGYLGRAESWVEARRLDAAPETDCVPLDDMLDQDTGEVFDQVSLLMPVNPVEYDALRERIQVGRKSDKKLARTLPADFVDALCADTSDLQGAGWPHPPAGRLVSYRRRTDALRPRAPVLWREAVRPVTTVTYRVAAKPLPRIEDAVKVGEDVRRAVMGLARRRLGDKAIPKELSGHDLPPDNRHGHAFFLPEDVDGDGRIERVLVHAPGGFGEEATGVLSHLRRVRTRDDGEWMVLREWATVDSTQAFLKSQLLARGRSWCSVTPYLHPWHLKKALQLEDQVRRECRERGMPDPAQIQRLPWLEIRGRRLNPIRFHRFRSKRGLTQPDTHGCFLRLDFPVSVDGPLALGFGCHFGLGLFRRIDAENSSDAESQ